MYCCNRIGTFWELFFEERREAQEYKPFVESDKWDYVDSAINYLLATENCYARPNERANTPKTQLLKIF